MPVLSIDHSRQKQSDFVQPARVEHSALESDGADRMIGHCLHRGGIGKLRAGFHCGKIYAQPCPGTVAAEI